MQGLWYGDKRDRVKWGALVYLAKWKGIHYIVQVAYFRHGPKLMLQIDEDEVPLSEEVWKHFSDLNHIKRLKDSTGLIINVLGQQFKPESRLKYIKEILCELKKIECPKIVFLDPDTGIAPKKAKSEHVTEKDIREIWAALSNGDLLVVYQHSDRTKKWIPDRKKKMKVACGDGDIGTITGTGIASDVAMLWCLKNSEPKSITNYDSIISNKKKNHSRHKTEKEQQTKVAEELLNPARCPCGCGEKPKKGTFMPGHDGRVSGWIRQIERKEKKIEDFPAIKDLYAAWMCVGKPGGNHPRLAAILKKYKEK
ncbi:MAG: hypothetical protein ACLPT6_03585 [Desulfobaccales bacterium]